MELDQAVAALDSMARQKKTSQSSVEKILNELLAGCVKSFMEEKDRESKSQD